MMNSEARSLDNDLEERGRHVNQAASKWISKLDDWLVTVTLFVP